MNITESLSDHGGKNQIPDRLIIHSMGQTIQDGDDLYSASGWLDHLGLSAHYLIHPDGSVQQCREENQIAWHAKGFNAGSIGIEILVGGTHDYSTFKEAIKTDWVTDDQFRVAVELSNQIIDRWAIPMGRVVRHSDLDYPRKVDPGEGFDWDKFKSQLI